MALLSKSRQQSWPGNFQNEDLYRDLQNHQAASVVKKLDDILPAFPERGVFADNDVLRMG